MFRAIFCPSSGAYAYDLQLLVLCPSVVVGWVRRAATWHYVYGMKEKTKPRKLDLYDVFCEVLYVLKVHIRSCQQLVDMDVFTSLQRAELPHISSIPYYTFIIYFGKYYRVPLAFFRFPPHRKQMLPNRNKKKLLPFGSFKDKEYE